MIALFLSAFGLGFIFNAAPGVVFSESVRRGIAGGYYPALSVQVGSLVGDATWAVLGLAGAGVLFQIPLVKTPIALMGSVYLGYLGVRSLMDAFSKTEISPAAQSAVIRSSAFSAGVTLSLTNPANIAYWAALGSVLGGLGIDEPQIAHYVVFFSGFMASSFIWCFICAGLIHLIYRLASSLFVNFINLACGLSLLGLATLSLVNIFKQ